MKCQVCGAESGKYPLCRACNSKKDQGLIIKCSICNRWHYKDEACQTITNEMYLYEAKPSLITQSEQVYFEAIKNSLPQGYHAFPQINLASIISKSYNATYHNELFRNLDFVITDATYAPKIAVEINDQTHLNKNRKERDTKVKNILEEAGIPLIKLWTSYGVNQEYVKNKIDESLNKPITRIHHFTNNETETTPVTINNETESISAPSNNPKVIKKNGCYIATCAYGSYDCPQVWTLRRYRDSVLSKTSFGLMFIHLYYAISPTLVKLLGNKNWFKKICLRILDRKVKKLNKSGLKDTPYTDNLSLSKLHSKKSDNETT